MAEDRTTDQKSPVLFVWETDAKQIIRFDATVSEDHTAESDLTDHPVESGVDFTDHIRRLPESIVVTGIVTDDPLIIDRTSNATPASTGGDPAQRAVSAYDWLLQTKDRSKLVAIFTKLRPYRNMVIQSISVTRDARESRIIRAVIVLREIRVAITEQVDVPEPRRSTKRRKSNQGKKTTSEESEANKKKSKDTYESLIIKGARALGF